ncbi:hypothetical protein ACTFIV_007598 [Dictyostelium citrinum]
MSIIYAPVPTLGVELKDLDPSFEEYRFVAKKFHEGLASPIKRIQVVCNKDLWNNYYQQLIKPKNYQEMFVFHGTRLNDPSLIYTEGLRVEKTEKGIYFAKYSSISDNFAHHRVDCKQMFLCRILMPYHVFENVFAHKTTDCSQIFLCRKLVPKSQVNSDIHIIRNNHHYPQYLISYIEIQ